MLRTKKSRLSERGSHTLQKMRKDDNTKVFFVRITKNEQLKLKNHLLKKGLTMNAWLKGKIKEMDDV